MEDLRNQIIRSFPNPDRIDCPNESDLRRVVLGDINQYPDSRTLIEHTLTCGPCTRQLCILLRRKRAYGQQHDGCRVYYCPRIRLSG